MKASSFPSSPPEVTSVNSGDTSAVRLLSQNWKYFREAQIFKNVSFHWGFLLCPCSDSGWAGVWVLEVASASKGGQTHVFQEEIFIWRT